MAIYSNVFLTSLFHFEYIYYTNTFKTRIGKGQCVCVCFRDTGLRMDNLF